MVNFVCYCTLLILVAVAKAQDNEETSSVATYTGDLTEEQCNTSRDGCCSELYIGEEEELTKCFVIHSTKLPADGDTDVGKTLRFLSVGHWHFMVYNHYSIWCASPISVLCGVYLQAKEVHWQERYDQHEDGQAGRREDLCGSAQGEGLSHCHVRPLPQGCSRGL
ncbi:Odorant-binding protein 58d [Drosophila yakuba]|uniref:Odorant-binding protein 58d n=1 Tax=Drosophila yakuba TaxID=7245 RepID=A0A0R1DSC4_DROYA|nr:Odorant-binding protein 58d [Drosophila yakuba]